MNNLKPGLDRGHTLAGAVLGLVRTRGRGPGRLALGLARHSLRPKSRCSGVVRTSVTKICCPNLTIRTYNTQAPTTIIITSMTIVSSAMVSSKSGRLMAWPVLFAWPAKGHYPSYPSTNHHNDHLHDHFTKTREADMGCRDGLARGVGLVRQEAREPEWPA